jgi:hypothetical protein
VRSRPSSGARSGGRAEADDTGDARRDGGEAAAIRRVAPRPTDAWRDVGARSGGPTAGRPTTIRPAPQAAPRREPAVRRVVEGIRDGASRSSSAPPPARATRTAPPPAAVRSAPARPSASAAPQSSRGDRPERRGAAAPRSRERASRDDGDRP